MPFTPGSLVAVRLGDGFTSAAPARGMCLVYLDEFSPLGVRRQSIMVSALFTNSPASASTAFTLPCALEDPGAAFGQLGRSPTGFYLALAGVNAPAGAPLASTTAPFLQRYIARLSGAADGVDISTVVSGPTAQSPALLSAAPTAGGGAFVACEVLGGAPLGGAGGGVARTVPYTYFSYASPPPAAPNGTRGACAFAAFDGGGNLWVARTQSSDVCVVSAVNVTLGAWGAGLLAAACNVTLTGVNDPRGLAVRGVSEFYVASYGVGVVRALRSGGVWAQGGGGAYVPGLPAPDKALLGCALDAALATLYVTSRTALYALAGLAGSPAWAGAGAPLVTSTAFSGGRTEFRGLALAPIVPPSTGPLPSPSGTPTPSATSTGTPSNTPSNTATPTPSKTATPSPSPTPSESPTNSASPTSTKSFSATASLTPSAVRRPPCAQLCTHTRLPRR